MVFIVVGGRLLHRRDDAIDSAAQARKPWNRLVHSFPHAVSGGTDLRHRIIGWDSAVPASSDRLYALPRAELDAGLNLKLKRAWI